MTNQQVWITDVMRRHEGSLLRYAQGLVHDSETARDLVQDCFLGLCSQDRRRLDGNVAQWLFTVCRNRAIDHLRQRGRAQELDDAEPMPEADPARHAETADDRSRLRAAIDRLPARQRELIRLKFEGRLSYKQISEVTGLSVSNVGFQLHTAIKTLRTRMGADGRES